MTTIAIGLNSSSPFFAFIACRLCLCRRQQIMVAHSSRLVGGVTIAGGTRNVQRPDPVIEFRGCDLTNRSAGEIIDKGGKLLIEILQMPSRPAVLSFGLK